MNQDLDNCKYEESKDSRITYIPVGQYLALIFSVPEGYLTTWEAWENYFRTIYGTSDIAIEEKSYWARTVGEKEVPYWKIIGPTGFIQANGYFYSQETQRREVEAQGFVIEAAGKEKKSIRVKDYKKYLYDLSQIDASCIINTDIPSLSLLDVIDDIRAGKLPYPAGL